MLLEKRHHLGAVAQERTLAWVQLVRMGLRTQVAFWGIVVFDDAFGNGQRVARNPQPAPRPGAGAAQLAGFFRNDHVQAVMRGGNGGRQARGTGTDDEYVAFEGLHARVPLRRW